MNPAPTSRTSSSRPSKTTSPNFELVRGRRVGAAGREGQVRRQPEPVPHAGRRAGQGARRNCDIPCVTRTLARVNSVTRARVPGSTGALARPRRFGTVAVAAARNSTRRTSPVRLTEGAEVGRRADNKGLGGQPSPTVPRTFKLGRAVTETWNTVVFGPGGAHRPGPGAVSWASRRVGRRPASSTLPMFSDSRHALRLTAQRTAHSARPCSSVTARSSRSSPKAGSGVRPRYSQAKEHRYELHTVGRPRQACPSRVVRRRGTFDPLAPHAEPRGYVDPVAGGAKFAPPLDEHTRARAGQAYGINPGHRAAQRHRSATSPTSGTPEVQWSYDKGTTWQPGAAGERPVTGGCSSFTPPKGRRVGVAEGERRADGRWFGSIRRSSSRTT